MFPGVNPKQMEQMMRQMGIKSEEIKAKRVIIEKEGERIIIEEPQITKIVMQGNASYQIGGKERVEEEGGGIAGEDDVKMVMEQAGVSEEEAKKALEEADGDIANAIMKLKGE
ncbi:nascent polypeptide-associated complex protein [Candidatus Micrarchaeota archaeon CG1_02_47_40]|nr:MAG: nascent polypeptide-associated complex protein [Candidatus Micrarchaeota archaeon CG1_02_47_40]